MSNVRFKTILPKTVPVQRSTKPLRTNLLQSRDRKGVGNEMPRRVQPPPSDASSVPTSSKNKGLSGVTTKRPALLRCVKKPDHSDTLIVRKPCWLGRSLRARDVNFHSLTEAIDTASPTSCAMWQMIGVPAELERSLISERTRAGVKAAQRRGVKFGRKMKLTPEPIDHARKLPAKGEARKYAARPSQCGPLHALQGVSQLK